jgi:hypothetical protein
MCHPKHCCSFEVPCSFQASACSMIALGDSSHERGASRNGAGKKNCTVATKDIRSGLVIRMTASGYHHINFT